MNKEVLDGALGTLVLLACYFSLAGLVHAGAYLLQHIYLTVDIVFFGIIIYLATKGMKKDGS